MTLVIYRNRVLAGDTSCWEGDIMVSEQEKVERLPDGALLGCCGMISAIQAFTDWARQGFPAGVDLPDLEHDEDFSALLIGRDGRINCYDHKYRREVSVREWAAIGAGVEFANGLLVAGYSAEKVVKAAIKHVAYVGGRVTSVSLSDAVDEAEVIEMPVEDPPEAWRERMGLV